MNTLLSSARIHSLIQQRNASSVLIKKLPCLSVKCISNSSACLAKSEEKNESFMSRLKKIFGKSSERSFGRMTLCHNKSGTVGKNMSGFLYRSEKVPNVCGRHGAVSYRQMSFLSSLKAVFGLDPKDSKPVPIREPNIPQKPVKDDKKDKKDKKPVVQTEENSEEELVMHVQSAMMDEHGNPVTEENFVRTEWGVRIKDQARKVDPLADAVENIEKPFYVVRSLWGVNVKQFMTRDEAARVHTAVPGSKNISSSVNSSNHNISLHKTKSPDTTDNLTLGSSSFKKEQSKQSSSKMLSIHQIKKSEGSKCNTKEKKSNDMVRKVHTHSVVLERKSCDLQVPSNTSTTETDRKKPKNLFQDNFNEVAPRDGINAWKDVIKRSANRQNEQNEQKEQLRVSLSRSTTVSGNFVQRELPEPKRDVKAVPSSRKRHPATSEMHGSDKTLMKVEGGRRGVGRKKPSANPSKVDETSNKKLHTSSTSSTFAPRYNAGAVKGYKNDTSLKTSAPNLNQQLFMDHNSLKITSSPNKVVEIDDSKKFVDTSKDFAGSNDPKQQ